MPNTSSARMTAGESVWDRTVLYPARETFYPPKETSEVTRMVSPKKGTSSRRQWLVQMRGPRTRRRRVLEFPPDLTEVTVGSGAACGCRVEDPGVVGVHAALVRRVNRGVYLVDLSKGARTLLNGEPVSEEVLLMDGDRITLGDNVEFEFLDGPRPGRSPVRAWARKVIFAASGMRRVR